MSPKKSEAERAAAKAPAKSASKAAPEATDAADTDTVETQAAEPQDEQFADLPFGKPAHFRDQPGQFLQIAVERLGDVF